MDKAKAIQLLGGTLQAAARDIGISLQAVSQWPDVLPDRIADRVLAALARKHLPPELIGGAAVEITGDGTGQASPPIPDAAYPAGAQPLEVDHAT